MSSRATVRRSARIPLQRAVEALRMSENTALIVVAAILGAMSGLASVAVKAMIDLVLCAGVGSGGESVLDVLSNLNWLHLMLLPAAGGLLVGPLVHFLAREAKGHGVPDVMEAVALRGGRIRPRVSVVKAVASSLCIGSGGSAGIEGPIVQIGSALGSTVGQVLGLRPDKLRVLVGAGAAAGIAATFNAPVAGVLFSIEIILGSYAIHTLTPLIIASVTGTIVAHAFPYITGGDVTVFNMPFRFQLVSAWEIPMYMVMGLAAALVAVLMTKVLYFCEDLFGKIPVPGWLKPSIGGLMVGGIFVAAMPVLGKAYLFGSGYRSMEAAMDGSIVIHGMLILIGLKILATSLTLGSGGSGGVFAPMLFIGAMTGGAFGAAMNAIFPGLTAPAGAYAVVGMGAVVAGAMRAPITAMLIIFEMTGDYKIILPIMVSCIIASLAASRIKKESIYTEKLSRKGVNVNQGMESTIIGSATVSDLTTAEVPKIRETEALNSLIAFFLKSHLMQIYVTDPADRLLGVVHINDVMALVQETGIGGTLIVADVMETKFPSARPDEPLSEAFRKFGTCHLDELPVMDRDGSGRIVGIVTFRSLFLFYNREVLRQSALGLKYVRGDDSTHGDYVWMPEDHEVRVVPAPAWAWGKTLKDLDVRGRFGVNVVAIRKHRHAPASDADVPDPARIIGRDETLVLVGRSEDIERMLSRGD